MIKNQKGAVMERLTKVMSCPDGTKIYDISNKLFGLNTSRADKTRIILEKLAEYEDLEEQGRLVKLPCKIGDTVYDTTWRDDVQEKVVVKGKTYCRTVRKHKVTKSTFDYSDIKEFGKTVFLTKSEAETKLRELRGRENGSME